MREAIVHDPGRLLREIDYRAPAPRAAILDRRARQSSPVRGSRAGYDGRRRRRGSTVHLAVDTLGHRLALLVTPANAQDRVQVQTATGESVEMAFVDQGYPGQQPAEERRSVMLAGLQPCCRLRRRDIAPVDSAGSARPRSRPA